MSYLKKYRRIKYLGKGSYGAAILAQLRATGQHFVIKEIVIGHLSAGEQAAARKEASVLHALSHSNITMYVESFVEQSKLFIVMEHADGGDLSAAIARRRSLSPPHLFPEDELMRIFVQICLALKHVHDHNILHRDLKSQNVFLTSQGIVKLGDFGIAKVTRPSYTAIYTATQLHSYTATQLHCLRLRGSSDKTRHTQSPPYSNPI